MEAQVPRPAPELLSSANARKEVHDSYHGGNVISHPSSNQRVNSMRTRIALLSVLIATSASAQQTAKNPQPSHVPIEFVEMLSLGPLGGAGKLAVGELPDELMRLLRPARGARIVGTMAHPMFSMSALVVPGTAQAVKQQWAARLTDAGWTILDVGMSRVETGFLSTARPVEGERHDGPICAPDKNSSIRLATAVHRADSVRLLLVRVTGIMAEECHRDPVAGAFRPTAPTPTLRAPEGAELQGTGSTGTGGTDAIVYGRLRSNQSLPALTAHYAAEMKREGWSAGVLSIGTGVAAQPFQRTSADGLRWQALLTLLPLQSGEKYLQLHLLRERQ